MKHVTCKIAWDHLIIKRNGIVVGKVSELNGEPTIQLIKPDNSPNDQMISLTRTDCNIIWDNWNTLQESNEAICSVIDELAENE